MIGPIPIFKHPHLPHHKETITTKDGKTITNYQTVSTGVLVTEAIVFIGVFATIDVLLSFIKKDHSKWAVLLVSVLILTFGCVLYQLIK